MIISGRLRRESSTDKDFVILIDPISVCCIGKESKSEIGRSENIPKSSMQKPLQKKRWNGLKC